MLQFWWQRWDDIVLYYLLLDSYFTDIKSVIITERKMACRYPEDSNIQVEVDSDNEVFLVHRIPDTSQENHVADATGIPGRPVGDRGDMGREMPYESNTSETTVLRAVEKKFQEIAVKEADGRMEGLPG